MAGPAAALAAAAAAKDPRVRRVAGTVVVLAVLAPMGMAVLVLMLVAGASGVGPVPAGPSHCVAGPNTPAGRGERFADVVLDNDQLAIAGEVLAAARGFDATAHHPRAGVIALATALQESSLRNLGHGDRDSLGVFQQRPSQGWGSEQQIRDVAYATAAFLERLVQVPDWHSLPLTVAAQAVQRSGHPSAYAKWEPAATRLVEQLWVTALTPRSLPSPDGGSPSGQVVVDATRCPSPDPGGGVPDSCTATGGSAENGLVPNARTVMRCTLTAFGPHRVGGVGGRPNASDHPNGRAVDIMIDDYDTATGNNHGWQIARWLQENAAQFGISYLIFDDRIWSSGRADEGWRTYCHPNHQATCGGGDTLRHLDHVHVSVRA